MSIDAQRRELAALAKSRQLKVAAEFVDAVESGKDDDRPGFQNMLRAVRNPRRGWDCLIVLDTSRLARNIYLAEVFKHECQKQAVRIIYGNLPESNPIIDMVLVQVMQAVDQMHSMTSRAKGLAGMRENVKQGFRAGGRAPLGYRLEHTETGAMRDGAAVRKSKLVPSGDAQVVQAFLRARVAGTPRVRAGLSLPDTSKVGMEWNALTYAGHTVWNVHAESGSGRKRRPRSEWVIQRDTHEALITDADAEILLTRLESYSVKRTRSREAGYLLSGLLVTPDGRPFHGDRGSYAAKGRRVKADMIDMAVAKHVMTDLQGSGFVRAVTKAARSLEAPKGMPELREALAATEERLTRLVGLVEQTSTPAPLLRQMEEVESERARLSDALAATQVAAAERAAVSKITEHEVRRLLVQRAAAIEGADPESLRDALAGLLDRVELDGDELRIHYRIMRDKVASPRGAEPIPVIRAHPARLQHQRRRSGG